MQPTRNILPAMLWDRDEQAQLVEQPEDDDASASLGSSRPTTLKQCLAVAIVERTNTQTATGIGNTECIK